MQINATGRPLARYTRVLELGRYRYLESVSVFGIFVSIFSCRFGIGILKYLGIRYRYFWNTGWKSQIFGIPTSIWRPCWGWPRRNFTNLPFGKLEWWGHQAIKKFDSKIGRFDTSTWQTDGHRTTAKTALWVALRREVNIYAFSHYVVWIVCFGYTLYS